MHASGTGNNYRPGAGPLYCLCNSRPPPQQSPEGPLIISNKEKRVNRKVIVRISLEGATTRQVIPGELGIQGEWLRWTHTWGSAGLEKLPRPPRQKPARI